jgi:hypothetical protein
MFKLLKEALMKRRVLSSLVVFVLTSVSLVNAQSLGTAITGSVSDQKGGVIPDATVVARNTGTNIERTTKTSSEGLYHFENLPPGIYDVRVEATAGFASAKAEGLKVQVGEKRDLNFTLTAAGATGSVTVTSEAPLVETTKTDVSTVVTDAQVASLPTTTSFGGIGGAANDYQGLAVTAPGVKYDTTAVSFDLLGPGAVNDRGIQVNIDGGNISDQVISTRDALGASVEEVKEFQVLTNNYNAEYGQAGGLVLNVITKSGTNAFHGDGHYYTRGRNLTASTFFYNLGDDARFRRAPFHKYEGGGTFGGPIIKNRTFFFTSYEQVRQAVPLTLVPNGVPVTVTQPTKELLISAKIDHQLTKRQFLTARYNVQRDITDNQLVQIASIASPESLVALVNHDNTLNISHTWNLTSNTINEFRFFWHRYLNQLPTKSGAVGISGPNIYTGAAFCCPQGGLQKRYQYIDNLSWTHGVHAIKTGFNISHFPYESLFQQFHFGQYTVDAAGVPSDFTIGIGPGFSKAKDNIYGFYGQDSWKLRPNLTLNYGLRYDYEAGAFTGGTIKSGNGCLQGNGIIPACSSDKNNFQPRIGIAWSPRFNSGFWHTLFGDQDRSVIRASFGEVTQLAFLNVVLDSLIFDGVNLLTASSSSPSILQFFPNRPPDAALATLSPNPQTTFGRIRPISPDLKNPEVRHVNLTVSRQLGNNFVFNVGYTGVFGFGLFGERDTNFPIIKADPGHPGFFYFGGRPDERFTAARTNENTRTSSYNSGFISAVKRFSNHVEFNASYTFSKLLTSTEDFFGLSEPGDPRDIGAERARSSNDVRHLGNFGIVFDTVGLTNRSFVKHLVNNWTIGTVGSLQSGRPYPISTGSFPFSASRFFGAGNETQQRPNVLPDGTLISTNIASHDGTTLLVSEAAIAQGLCPGCPQTTFVAPLDADPRGAIDSLGAVDANGDPVIVDFQFVNGNLGRNAAITDPYYRFDMSFIRAFHIVPGHENMRLEFKVDVFNILNRTNFLGFNGNDDLNLLGVSASPNCTLCLDAHTGRYVGSNGQALTIQDLRHGRVSRDLLNPIFGGIGDPTTSDLARTIQLAVRFKF